MTRHRHSRGPSSGLILGVTLAFVVMLGGAVLLAGRPQRDTVRDETAP